MAKNNGTVVIAEVRPFDSADQFPVAFANEVKGGYHSVADLTARDAIYPDRRAVGMMCYVESEGSSFRLVGGIENSDWVSENFAKTGQIAFKISNPLIPISSGIVGEFATQFPFLFTSWSLTSDLPSTISIDVLKCSVSNYPDGLTSVLGLDAIEMVNSTNSTGVADEWSPDSASDGDIIRIVASVSGGVAKDVKFNLLFEKI